MSNALRRAGGVASLALHAACSPAPGSGAAGSAATPIATSSSAAASSAAASSATVAAPPWPAPHLPPPIPDFEPRIIHHETIHASVLIPKGSKVESTRDGNGYPLVRIEVDGRPINLQFDSGVGHLGGTLAKEPPTVYGLATDKVAVTPDGVAARYRDAQGHLRILGMAPGIKCADEPPDDVPARTLDRIFAVCASLRSPPPGAWRPSTSVERSHGGMTAVPEGAWVEGALPSTGGSLLRPGAFVARMHLGGPAPSAIDYAVALCETFATR